MIKNKLNQKGFTLLEILLVIAIIGVIFGFSIPILYTYQIKNNLYSVSQNIADALRRAQLNSRAGKNDSSWGVYVQDGSSTFFKGDSYSERDTEYDEVFDIFSNITLAEPVEIVFEKQTGLLESSATIVLLTPINDGKTITINKKGRVNY